MTNSIIPGLVDNHTEFISVAGKLHGLHRGVASNFQDLPKRVHQKLHAELASDPDALQALQEWGLYDPEIQLEQFTWCRFGGNDGSADLTSCGRFNPDYHDCGSRGQCPFEGRICVNKHGLTSRELQILKLIASGEMQKNIALQLGITEVTVAKMRKKLFIKTGCQSSVDLTRFALQHNYISHE